MPVPFEAVLHMGSFRRSLLAFSSRRAHLLTLAFPRSLNVRRHGGRHVWRRRYRIQRRSSTG
jgi:hypothetical protein